MTNSVNSIAKELEERHGLTPGLLAALVRQESGGRMDAVSPAGARGMTQFMPGTRQHMISRYGVDPWRDPESALKATALYLSEIRETVGNDPAKMLAAYNWGPGRVRDAVARYGNDWLSHAPRETKGYVANIMRTIGQDINFSYTPGSGDDDDEISRRRRRLRGLGMSEEDVERLTPEEVLGMQFITLILSLAISAANRASQQPAPTRLQVSDVDPGLLLTAPATPTAIAALPQRGGALIS